MFSRLWNLIFHDGYFWPRFLIVFILHAVAVILSWSLHWIEDGSMMESAPTLVAVFSILILVVMYEDFRSGVVSLSGNNPEEDAQSAEKIPATRRSSTSPEGVIRSVILIIGMFQFIVASAAIDAVRLDAGLLRFLTILLLYSTFLLIFYLQALRIIRAVSQGYRLVNTRTGLL